MDPSWNTTQTAAASQKGRDSQSHAAVSRPAGRSRDITATAKTDSPGGILSAAAAAEPSGSPYTVTQQQHENNKLQPAPTEHATPQQQQQQLAYLVAHGATVRRRPRPPLLGRGLWCWCRAACLPESEVVRTAGLDVAVYLRVVRLGVRISLFLSFWCCAVVLPVNITVSD